MQLGKSEEDESLPPPGEVIDATVLNWTNKYILFRYSRLDQNNYGVFRANSVYVNGVKAKKWETNDLDLFFQSNGLNVNVSNFIPYNSALGKAELAFKLNGLNGIVRPKICAVNAWIGEKQPPEEDLLFGQKKASEYKILENQIGQVISFDKQSNIGWLRFKNIEVDGVIKFRLNTLILRGESPSKEESSQYIQDLLDKSEEDRLLMFDCVYDSAKHSSTIPLERTGEQWVACSVWPYNEKRPISNDGGQSVVPCEVKKENQRLKQNFPMPWEATSKEVDACILSSDGVIGKASLMNDSKTVLFTRSRCYVDGRLVKFVKDVNYFKPNVNVKMDIVEADPNESQGIYDYVAVLVWIGQKPEEEDVIKEMENPTSYRAKVIKLSPPIPGVGITSGVLHILNGSAFANERVIFSRDVVYIFSFSMVKGDLAYVLKEFDKVNVEFKLTTQEERDETLRTYGCIIKYKASCVWIGYFPRAVVETYNYKNLTPFLTKRDLTLGTFKEIVDGTCEPKINDPLPEDNSALPPNNLIGRLIEIKKPDYGSTDGTQRGVMEIENGPHAKKKAFFNRNSLFIFGRNMYKADLMRVVKESDKFFIDVQGDTNSSQVPFKVTKAWIGLHPDEYKRLKQCLSPYFANKFNNWLSSHGMTEEEFEECVAGKAPIKPYFPFTSEQMNARIIYFYPPTKGVDRGVEFGLLKITQGPLMKRDVLFERSDFYLFNVCLKNVDLSKLLKEGEKVFCEVSEIIGKDRKIWQTRLGVSGVPRYSAKLVWILGARPKPTKLNMNYETNETLIKWLRKRNYDMEAFIKLIKNEPKTNPPSFNESSCDTLSKVNEDNSDDKMSHMDDQAHRLITKVLRCSILGNSADLSDAISSETELNLAIFLHDRLKKAISYKCGGVPSPENHHRPNSPTVPPVIPRESYDNSLGWANKDQNSLLLDQSLCTDMEDRSIDKDFFLNLSLYSRREPSLRRESQIKYHNFSSVYPEDSLPSYCRTQKPTSSDSYFSYSSNPLIDDSKYDLFNRKGYQPNGNGVHLDPPLDSLSSFKSNTASIKPHESTPARTLLLPSTTPDAMPSDPNRVIEDFRDSSFKRKFTPGEH